MKDKIKKLKDLRDNLVGLKNEPLISAEKKQQEEIDKKNEQFERLKKEKSITEALLISTKHQKDINAHISLDEKQQIVKNEEHTKEYHIEEKQTDAMIDAVNQNTSHSNNNSIHFDSAEQKKLVVDSANTPAIISTGGAGGAGRADKFIDHSLLKNTNWDVAGHTINTSILPEADNTHDLGSEEFAFAELHSKKIIAVEGINANATISSDTGMIIGDIDETSAITVTGDGGIGLGEATVSSSITAGAIGAIASGDVDSGGSVTASNVGSLAKGSAVFSGSITASGVGATAQGDAADGTSITASGDGSFAQGCTDQSGTITAGIGSIASGTSNNSGEIEANNGSLAIGTVTAGNIKALAASTVQVGEGTNSQPISIQVGSGIRINGTVDAPASGLHNGDMWVDSFGNVWVRTGGVSKNMSNI